MTDVPDWLLAIDGRQGRAGYVTTTFPYDEASRRAVMRSSSSREGATIEIGNDACTFTISVRRELR